MMGKTEDFWAYLIMTVVGAVLGVPMVFLAISGVIHMWSNILGVR